MGKVTAKERKTFGSKKLIQYELEKKRNFLCNFLASNSSGHCDLSHNCGLRNCTQVKSSGEYVY